MAKKKYPKSATIVTPLSKYLAMIFFVLLLFLGFYLGIQYQQSLNTPQVFPNKLIVTREKDTIDNLASLSETITDEKQVKKLYEDILALPTPISNDIPKPCPIDFLVRYSLDFFQNDNVLLHVEYDPTGCRRLQIQNHISKKGINPRLGINISVELQKILNVSDKDFYGSQNGRNN